MSDNKGWVKVYRAVEDNKIWTCEKFSKGQAWIDLIMMVNHKEEKIILGNEFITIKTGYRWTSIVKLAKRWKWSEHKTRDYLHLLESDGMITVQSTKKGVLIGVQNYAEYQGIPGSKGGQKGGQKADTGRTEGGVKADRLPTNKNDKEDIRMIKNEKEGKANSWEGGYES